MTITHIFFEFLHHNIVSSYYETAPVNNMQNAIIAEETELMDIGQDSITLIAGFVIGRGTFASVCRDFRHAFEYHLNHGIIFARDGKAVNIMQNGSSQLFVTGDQFSLTYRNKNTPNKPDVCNSAFDL